MMLEPALGALVAGFCSVIHQKRRNGSACAKHDRLVTHRTKADPAAIDADLDEQSLYPTLLLALAWSWSVPASHCPLSESPQAGSGSDQ